MRNFDQKSEYFDKKSKKKGKYPQFSQEKSNQNQPKTRKSTKKSTKLLSKNRKNGKKHQFIYIKHKKWQNLPIEVHKFFGAHSKRRLDLKKHQK
jgi:hypothetical protein